MKNKFVNVDTVFNTTKYYVITLERGTEDYRTYGFLDHLLDKDATIPAWRSITGEAVYKYINNLAPIESIEDTLKFAATHDFREYEVLDDIMKIEICNLIYRRNTYHLHLNLLIRKEIKDEVYNYIKEIKKDQSNLGLFCNPITELDFDLKNEIALEIEKYNDRIKYLIGLSSGRNEGVKNALPQLIADASINSDEVLEKIDSLLENKKSQELPSTNW